MPLPTPQQCAGLLSGDPESRLRVLAAWGTDDDRPLVAAAAHDGADEIKRLRADLALLIPVSLPASQMEQCGYCYTLCAETWKHCPNCGAQARVADRSVRHSKPSK